MLGRFRTVRVAYGGFRRLTDGRVAALAAGASTLFPNADVQQIVRSIFEEAVFVGLDLPADTVAEINAFARSEPLHASYDPYGATFRRGPARKSPRRKIRVYRWHSRSATLSGRRSCCERSRLAIDRARRQTPRRILTILDWSFASDLTDNERRKLGHVVIDYHYDGEGCNFVYASFYITDTNRHFGAHVMMKRSHDKKPLRMLLGPVSEAVRKRYGIENELTIDGFVQDTSYYHRATSPTHGDRLMLAVRFINCPRCLRARSRRPLGLGTVASYCASVSITSQRMSGSKFLFDRSQFTGCLRAEPSIGKDCPPAQLGIGNDGDRIPSGIFPDRGGLPQLAQ